MKNNFVLLVLMTILILSLSGCGTDKNALDADTHSALESEDGESLSNEDSKGDLQIGEEEEGEIMPDWLVAAQAIYLYDYDKEYLVKGYGYDEYLSAIEKSNSTVDYYNYANELYNQALLECTNDEERDFLECMIKYYFNYGSEKDAPIKISESPFSISKVWSVGYDENGMIDSEITAYHRYTNVRSIVSEIKTSEGETSYLDFIIYDSEHSDGTIISSYTALRRDDNGNKSYIGIDTERSEGILEPEASVLQEFELARKGANYKEENLDLFAQIVNDNYEMFDLVRDYLDVYLDKKSVVDERKSSREPVDPQIGMTKAQLENITWGEPSKKNVDEYEFGTYEQWVYPGKGYIYLEDGVVTSISYRR